MSDREFPTTFFDTVRLFPIIFQDMIGSKNEVSFIPKVF